MNYNCVAENSIEFLLWMKYLSLSFFYLSSFLVPNGVLISIQLFSLPIVTGSGKRDIFAQTMIFQYKRCCSKNVILFIIQKKNFLA